MTDEVAAIDDIETYLASSEPITEIETFGTGEHAFDVRIRRLDKVDLERLLKAGRKKVNDRRTGYREEADPERMRYELANKGLAGWDGLTVRKLMILANKSAAAANGTADAAVTFSVDNAVKLMRVARGIVDGEPMTFEEWVLERVTRVADRAAREDVAGKNA